MDKLKVGTFYQSDSGVLYQVIMDEDMYCLLDVADGVVILSADTLNRLYQLFTGKYYEELFEALSGLNSDKGLLDHYYTVKLNRLVYVSGDRKTGFKLSFKDNEAEKIYDIGLANSIAFDLDGEVLEHFTKKPVNTGLITLMEVANRDDEEESEES